MKKNKFLANIAFLTIALASCSFDESGSGTAPLASESEAVSSFSSEPSHNVPSSSGHASSSPQGSAVTSKPGRRSSSSSSSSSPASSSAASSSDPRVYKTVSIYQCYYIPSKDTYGNPRFDFSVRAEEGKPLFSGTNEAHTLGDMTNPEYTPIGGTYSPIGFFIDEACTVYATDKTIVMSDMDIFYYCRG